MLEDRATGMPWTAIGKKYGVSHETARKGAQEAAKIQAELGVVDVDPANVMANVVRAQVRALYRSRSFPGLRGMRGRRRSRVRIALAPEEIRQPPHAPQDHPE